MKNYTLGGQDLNKILKGACIAVGGAFLTYLLSIIGKFDFGTMTPIITALLSILINTGVKILDGNAN